MNINGQTVSVSRRLADVIIVGDDMLPISKILIEYCDKKGIPQPLILRHSLMIFIILYINIYIIIYLYIIFLLLLFFFLFLNMKR